MSAPTRVDIGPPTAPWGGPRTRRLLRERPLFLTPRTRLACEAAAFLAIAVVLLIFFRPDLLLSSTTTTGGDTGAHIYTPWYLKTHLIPHGQLSGWSPDWYAGFPILHFYFPLVVGLQAVLSYLIPYEIAFKLGTVLGTFFFPVAIYLFLRLLRLRFPVPIVGALLSLGFLFMDSFQINGGNIPSTLAGEYSFSLSLGLLFVFLGMAYRVATGDDGRPLLASGVLALTALSHLVPVMMAVICAPLLVYWGVRTHGIRTGLQRLGGMFALAFALTAFWALPFVARLSYSADMHWFPINGWGHVFPRELWIYLVAALLAIVTAALRRDRRILLCVVPAAVGGALYFAVGPNGLFEGRVWNGRFLPFWYLGAFLASAYLIGTMTPTLARWIWRRRTGAMAITVVAVIGLTMSGTILRDKGSSYIDNWIQDNYEGYEAKEAFPTFTALMDQIRELPPGRVMWEPSPDLVEFGTTVALMTIPYWTGHATMEGIYFESSVTTPYHFLTASEIAAQPSNPIPELPYHAFDMQRGLQHMQLLDVSYFLSTSQKTRRAATATDGLRRITDVGRYSLFQVAGTGQVTIPRYQPVVIPDRDWTEANLAWFSNPDDLAVPLVRNGPDEWPRASSATSPLPRLPVENGGRSVPATVSDDEIDFTTDAIGQPHWVKTSYFPNWKVDGARGPYYASPSMMMVIPTQAHVRLHYERTWPEWVGLFTTLGALGLLVGLWIRRRRKPSIR